MLLKYIWLAGYLSPLFNSTPLPYHTRLFHFCNASKNLPVSSTVIIGFSTESCGHAVSLVPSPMHPPRGYHTFNDLNWSHIVQIHSQIIKFNKYHKDIRLCNYWYYSIICDSLNKKQPKTCRSVTELKTWCLSHRLYKFELCMSFLRKVMNS